MFLKVCNKKLKKKKINEDLKLSESDDDESILRLYSKFFYRFNSVYCFQLYTIKSIIFMYFRLT